MSVIFLSGPIGAGKTAVAQELLQLLPAPLSYIEGDTFWSFIGKGGERGSRDTFPVLVRSMTAAAIPFARSGFRVLIDFSIPPASPSSTAPSLCGTVEIRRRLADSAPGLAMRASTQPAQIDDYRD